MGLDYSVYLGPYLEATLVEKTVTRHKRHCTNKECLRYEKTIYEAFCPKCGTKIEDIPFETTDWCAANEDDYDDDFFHYEIIDYLSGVPLEDEPFNVLVANQKIDGIDRDLSFDPRSESPDFEDFNGEIIEAEKSAFTKTFAPQIKKLEGFFGKENLQLKWGQLSWIW